MIIDSCHFDEKELTLKYNKQVIVPGLVKFNHTGCMNLATDLVNN